MKTKEIRDLIDFIASTGLNEVRIETEELKLSVKRERKVTKVIDNGVSSSLPAAAPPPVAVAVPESTPQASAPDTGSIDAYVEIKSPMIGTFYRSANPESDFFVNVGDSVSAGQAVCIIEAMKLFNEIESEISGTIVKVLVENGTPIEYDQPIFLVDPS